MQSHMEAFYMQYCTITIANTSLKANLRLSLNLFKSLRL